MSLGHLKISLRFHKDIPHNIVWQMYGNFTYMSR